MHDLFPQPRGIENIGLFHAAQLLTTLLSGFKADAANSANFLLGVAQLVNGNFLTIFFKSFMLSEVNAANQLPDNDKINSLVHNGLLQGRGIRQLRPDLGRTVVGVNAHAGSEPQQALFGTHIAGNIIPLRAANGTQQHTVGSAALVQLPLGQRIAILIDGAAAHIHIGIGKFVTVEVSHLIQHQQCLIHDLRADAVTANHCNILFHGLTPPSARPAGRPFE